MFTLEKISLFPFIHHLATMLHIDYYNNLYIFLTTNKIYDFKRLEEFMRAGYPLVNNKEFYKMLEKAYKTLSRINSRQLEPQTYSSNQWLINDNHFQQLIVFTDNAVILDDILIKNPVNARNTKSQLDWCTISFAKDLMGKITIDGKNALAEVLKNVGPTKINKIADNISLYDEQIRHIIKETPESFTGNLFFKDWNPKNQIISTEIKDIVLYLVNNGEYFMWGQMTDKAKKAFLQAVLNPKSERNVIRQNIITLLTNYTTLSEVENGLTRTRAIDKFIIR